MITDERLESDFTYHNREPDVRVPKYQRIRDTCKALAYLICSLVPEGREQSLALTKIEEASMWANAGIARAPEDQA